jgi:hypothetical protein
MMKVGSRCSGCSRTPVMWINPPRRMPGYAPCSGLSARLDRMVAGGSLAMFVELLEVLADA